MIVTTNPLAYHDNFDTGVYKAKLNLPHTQASNYKYALCQGIQMVSLTLYEYLQMHIHW